MPRRRRALNGVIREGVKMFKRFRVALPILQILLALIAYGMPKVNTNLEFDISMFALRDVVTKMNFPVLVVLSPLLYLLDRISRNFPPATGVYFIVVAVIGGVVLMAVIGGFWYLVILEIDLRRHGQSFIRFNNRIAQIVTVVIMLCLGLGSIVYSYIYLRGVVYFRPAQAVLGAICLLAWGLFFLRLSLTDARYVFGTSRKAAM